MSREKIGTHWLLLGITGGLIYWGAVLFFTLMQFWVICSPAFGPCPTLMDSGLRALGVLLAGGAVFAVFVWIVRFLSR